MIGNHSHPGPPPSRGRGVWSRTVPLLIVAVLLGAASAAAEERILRETPFGRQELRTPDGRREELPKDPLDKGGYVERTITPRVFGAPEPTPLRDSYRLNGADQRGSFRPRPLPSSGGLGATPLDADRALAERSAARGLPRR